MAREPVTYESLMAGCREAIELAQDTERYLQECRAEDAEWRKRRLKAEAEAENDHVQEAHAA